MLQNNKSFFKGEEGFLEPIWNPLLVFTPSYSYVCDKQGSFFLFQPKRKLSYPLKVGRREEKIFKFILYVKHRSYCWTEKKNFQTAYVDSFFKPKSLTIFLVLESIDKS